MLDQRAYLRIREGAFTFLLTATPAVLIEHREHGPFEIVRNSLTVALSLSGGGQSPVVRLGALFEAPVAEWEYAALLSGGMGIAAEQIHIIPEPDIPSVQPFNPIGARLPASRAITGVCLHTEPPCLVLDLSRLDRCLRRAAGLTQV